MLNLWDIQPGTGCHLVPGGRRQGLFRNFSLEAFILWFLPSKRYTHHHTNTYLRSSIWRSTSSSGSRLLLLNRSYNLFFFDDQLTAFADGKLVGTQINLD